MPEIKQYTANPRPEADAIEWDGTDEGFAALEAFVVGRRTIVRRLGDNIEVESPVGTAVFPTGSLLVCRTGVQAVAIGMEAEEFHAQWTEVEEAEEV